MIATRIDERLWDGARLRLDAVGGALCLCTCDGRILGATPAARQLLVALGPEAADRIPADLWRSTCGTPLGEATLWTPPARDERIGCTRHPVGDELFLLVMREISDKQRALAHRLHQQRLESTGRLVASLAHDLRAALAPIVFNAAILEAEPTDPVEHRQLVSEIAVAATSLRRIIDEVLDFARLGPPRRDAVSLLEVLSRAGTLLRSLLRAQGSTVSLEIPAEATWVHGNPIVIEQIALNLVLNAIEAGPRTHIAISASPEPEGAFVRVRFHDEGPGIPELVRGRIFEPFFTTKDRGTGLGLATSREAARELGGDLLLEAPRSGTTFALLLPMARGAS